MNIQLTSSAHARMRQFLDRSPGAAGVRFGARQSGCSGFSYIVELADTAQSGDTTVDIDGIPLIINNECTSVVDGTVIDFRRQGLNEQFVFDNPNAKGECGCGDSFTV